MPTGTLIQKMACQFQPSTTAPPISGPTATPRPAMPPQMPMASGRRLRLDGAGQQRQRQRHDAGAAEALDGAGDDQLRRVGAEGGERPTRA